MRQLRVGPEFVPRSHLSPKRGTAATINKADNAFAVDCRRNRLAKPNIPEPRLLSSNFWKVSGRNIVQIKEEKVVFKPRSHVVEAIAPSRSAFFQNRKISALNRSRISVSPD